MELNELRMRDDAARVQRSQLRSRRGGRTPSLRGMATEGYVRRLGLRFRRRFARPQLQLQQEQQDNIWLVAQQIRPVGATTPSSARLPSSLASSHPIRICSHPSGLASQASTLAAAAATSGSGLLADFGSPGLDPLVPSSLSSLSPAHATSSGESLEEARDSATTPDSWSCPDDWQIIGDPCVAEDPLPSIKDTLQAGVNAALMTEIALVPPPCMPDSSLSK
ncbi:MAG: hypothetical protein M1821_005601 [Bathelium mastoideum]|nr:MAG: hypothetical protein M1821_005601 [Bathelium mastoideum]